MLCAAESLSGIAKDKNTGALLAGVTVILGEKSDSDKPIIDTVLTGADGSYRFDGLHAITEVGFGFYLHCRLERYAVHVTDLIQIQPGQARQVDIELAKVVSLTVTVRNASGAPLPGTHVALNQKALTAQPGFFELGYNVLTGETDSRGELRLGGLAPGGLGLTLALPGYRTIYLRDSAEGRAFEESLSVVLPTEDPALSKTIIGIKRTVSGKITGGEQVHFLCGDSDAAYILYDTVWKEVGSAAVDSGRFNIEGIPRTCQGGLLRTTTDSATVALTGNETRLTFTIREKPRILSVREGVASKTRSDLSATRMDGVELRRGTKAFTVLGRRANP
jgi:hypothetical protein